MANCEHLLRAELLEDKTLSPVGHSAHGKATTAARASFPSEPVRGALRGGGRWSRGPVSQRPGTRRSDRGAGRPQLQLQLPPQASPHPPPAQPGRPSRTQRPPGAGRRLLLLLRPLRDAHGCRSPRGPSGRAGPGRAAGLQPPSPSGAARRHRLRAPASHHRGPSERTRLEGLPLRMQK